MKSIEIKGSVRTDLVFSKTLRETAAGTAHG